MGKFKVGDRVIINSRHPWEPINTKGIISFIRHPLHNEPSVLWYIVDYIKDDEERSTGFKSDHIRLDTEWYRNQKIAHVLTQ